MTDPPEGTAWSELTPERWARVERILDAALERPPSQWADLLDETCAGDPGVRVEVESLLAHYPEVEEFLEFPAVELTGPGEPSRTGDPRLQGRRIGAYRVVREIGRGGMGQVLLAERADEHFEQRVAVKVLQPGLESDDLRHRFRAERQILAGLEHPSIARLIDGGVTDDGRPYLVMEHVEGEPIDEYCDRRRLPVRERLHLFLQAAEAVQYAHRNLIVHRDLKPSNIHVVDDGAGRVKLLDFGIARLLDSEGGVPTEARTRSGRRWMTPEYAAPEQVRGEAVTTATDVYQLGLVLYELLTGHRPFERYTDNRHRMERAVLETDPARPSTAVTRATGSDSRSSGERTGSEQIARARATGPDRLRRTLRGDLDAIVLKALRKEPETRYGSVPALIDDLNRYLSGLPVVARRGTVIYRAKKFVRRHAVGVAVGAAFLVLVVGSAVALGLQAERVARERDRARQTTAFVTSLFQEFAPTETREATVPTREILDRAVERVRSELADEPLVQADLLDALGEVYRYRGLFTEAERTLEAALAIRRRELGPGDLSVADSRVELASLRYHLGDFEAETLLARAIRTYRERLPPDDPLIWHAVEHRALALRDRGDYAAAESLFREIVRQGSGSDGPIDATRATALTYLAKLLTWKREYEEAEAYVDRALVLRRTMHGEEHPVVANALEARGELMLARGDVRDAERTFQDVQAMRREFFPDDHADVAAGLWNLGLARLAMRDLVTADSLLGQALTIYRRDFGKESLDVAKLFRHVGAVRLAAGDLVSADTLFEKALAIWRRMPSLAGHPGLSDLLIEIAELRVEQGRPAAAEPLLREALKIRREALPGGGAPVTEVRERLASLGGTGNPSPE